jgi:hypothetical protein
VPDLNGRPTDYRDAFRGTFTHGTLHGTCAAPTQTSAPRLLGSQDLARRQEAALAPDCSQSLRRKPTLSGSDDLLLTSPSCVGRVDLYRGFVDS